MIYRNISYLYKNITNTLKSKNTIIMANTTITTGLVRLSYAHLFVATSMNPEDAKKYSTSVLIPKTDKATIKLIQEAIAAAQVAGADKIGKTPASKIANPLKDGDEEKPEDENYAGMMYFNCSSQRQPKVVDANKQEILDDEEVYSGCWGRVNVNFYAYNYNNVKKGVAAGLNAFQKLKDGDRLGGGAVNIDDAFGDSDDLL